MNIYGIGRAMIDYYLNSKPLEFNSGGFDISGPIHINGLGFDNLLQLIDKTNIIRLSGGSCCNALKTLAQLGHSTFFSGTIGDSDIFAEADFFSRNLAENGVTFLPYIEKGKTGRCLIYSKDSKESIVMAASPEVASKISFEQISTKLLSNSNWCIVEGMELENIKLWKALSQNIVKNKIPLAILCGTKFGAEKTAAFLCNLDSYSGLSKYIKLIFANDNEASVLKKTGIDFIEYSQKKGFIFVITHEDKGSSAFINGKEIFEKATPSTSNFCESTGAGDVFAGAFLHKYMESMGTEQIHECLKTGNYFAQKILSVSLCDTKVLANPHNSTSN